ncbi:hypothetical protein AX15_001659 [Amanita polypyramis BW_CC]|nr:hypothetical protein AX15_001659 [Amanita polypyramis BW_CC]
MPRKRKSEQVKVESPVKSVNGDSNQNEDSSAAKRCKLNWDGPRTEMPEEDRTAVNSPACNVAPTSTEIIAREFTKHNVHWLPDGDILIQIGQVRFKLHRSTLVKHSKLLRGMVEDPSYGTRLFVDEETGTTVHCLDGLNIDVDDFIVLLNALDDAISYFYKVPPFRTVASILRAADALEFSQFKEFGIWSLEKNWPFDLDKLTISRGRYAAEVIQLARRCNITSVFKRTFYELVRSEGFRQETDSEIEKDDEDEERTKAILEKDDYALLLDAREKLTAFWMRKAVPPSETVTCSSLPSLNPQYCAIYTGRVHAFYKSLVHDSKIFEKYRYDPVCGMDALFDAPWGPGEQWQPKYGITQTTVPTTYVCPVCCYNWRTKWREEKRKLWEDLDTWFNLEEESEATAE